MSGFGYIMVGLVMWWLLFRYMKSRANKKTTDQAAAKPVFIDKSSSASASAGRVFSSKVVGVTYTNPDGVKRQDIIESHCSNGQTLLLEPEPDNPKDPNAVAVWVPVGQIGYIERGQLAADLHRYLRTNIQVTAEISGLTGGTTEQPTRGVNISIHIWQ